MYSIMAMKVDQAAAAEPQSVQTTVVSSTPSAISASSTKVSMFSAKKSGFVIPKNKLSGALVPIFRASGKADASDSTKEDTTKQVQRKTKWGIDITQDATVRRGRSLAYQTRVEQIMQQLKARVSEVADDEGLQLNTQDPNDDSAGQQTDKACKLELLELETREAIGEILLLNPNYKAPPDYKPLLKEAKVPIPIYQEEKIWEKLEKCTIWAYPLPLCRPLSHSSPYGEVAPMIPFRWLQWRKASQFPS
ncbi:hypothetical protein ACLOJK_006504 [Asimina triloba]